MNSSFLSLKFEEKAPRVKPASSVMASMLAPCNPQRRKTISPASSSRRRVSACFSARVFRLEGVVAMSTWQEPLVLEAAWADTGRCRLDDDEPGHKGDNSH